MGKSLSGDRCFLIRTAEVVIGRGPKGTVQFQLMVARLRPCRKDGSKAIGKLDPTSTRAVSPILVVPVGLLQKGGRVSM